LDKQNQPYISKSSFFGLSLASFIRYVSFRKDFYSHIYHDTHSFNKTNEFFRKIIIYQGLKLERYYKKAKVSLGGINLLKTAINDTISIFSEKYSKYAKEPSKYNCNCLDILENVKKNKLKYLLLIICFFHFISTNKSTFNYRTRIWICLVNNNISFFFIFISTIVSFWTNWTRFIMRIVMMCTRTMST